MIVIGLTGSFGSGCTYIAKEFIVPNGYEYISLSDCLRKTYEEEMGRSCELPRHEMQDYGTNIRNKNGADFLALKAIEIIKASNKEKWIVDGIRNPNEALAFRNEFRKFFLVALRAEFDTRWNRVKSKYNDDQRLFVIDDKRDSDEKLSYGQRVRECYEIADIIIANDKDCNKGSDAYALLERKVLEYVELIENKRTFQPTEQEALMAMAYATSMRSSCLQRKVGAVIVDSRGNVFSSGYNEVPIDQQTCKAKYGKCYRKVLKEEFSSELFELLKDNNLKDEVNKLFQDKFKILDYCRALHAEENAIINVARFGSDGAIKGATLYTTTYPCNLCANKIVQMEIKTIYYMEPYPMVEAKKTFSTFGVEQIPFEGVSFNGYFKFM